MRGKEALQTMMKRAGLEVGAKYVQQLSDIYLIKAETETDTEVKKHYYNKVLFYAGLRAAMEEICLTEVLL